MPHGNEPAKEKQGDDILADAEEAVDLSDSLPF